MKTKITAIAVLLLSITHPTPASAAGWTPISMTVAGGNGTGSYMNQLAAPWALTLDSDGALYVADSGNSRVQVIEFTAGSPDAATTAAGGNDTGPNPDQLDSPRGVLIGPDGTMYISDHGNHRVQRRTVRNDGSFGPAITIAGGTGPGSGANQLKYPYGLALSADGALYIADTANSRVQRVTFDSNGLPNLATTIAGGNGPGANIEQLAYPRGLVVDHDGSLLIADRDNNRIQRVYFEDDGTPKRMVTVTGGNGSGSGPNQLAGPYDIAIDAQGSLYIADSGNHRIQLVTFDSSDTPRDARTIFGNGQGSGDDQLDSPQGIAIDIDGATYILDHENHRVQRVMFDTTSPTVSLDTTSARVEDTATIDFNCADTGGSSVDTCTATIDGQAISSGDSLDTRSRRSQILVVTGTDNAGNATTEAIEFTVYGKHELTGDYSKIDGTPATVARLYMATFAPDPDHSGYEFWADTYGTTDKQVVANFFATSPEFVGLYGDTTNNEFVDLMYSNVMTRDPEPAGRAYWLGQLDNGMTQAQMLLWFSESPEFKFLTYPS